VLERGPVANEYFQMIEPTTAESDMRSRRFAKWAFFILFRKRLYTQYSQVPHVTPHASTIVCVLALLPVAVVRGRRRCLQR